MKNSADLGGCYPPRPLASVDNTLLDLQNSWYPTQPQVWISVQQPSSKAFELAAAYLQIKKETKETTNN